MKKHLLLVFVLISSYSCKNNSENDNLENIVSNKRFEKIELLEWLLGTWTNESGQEFSQETWSKENDSTFTAFRFTQVEDETIFSETMALEEKDGRLFLTVSPANKKGSSPVTLRFISSEKNQFIFENKSNDFPERIIYTNPTKDSLHAWIEGPDKENKKVEFNFSRKN